MKQLMIFLTALFFSCNLAAQTANSEYDSTLAKSLGADDYGMKNYVFVLLKSGANKLEKGHERDSIFKGHLENIGRLANMGKLIIAGPFGANDKSYEGIFIFNVRTIDEAKDLLKTDPAVQANLLNAEMYDWYGSAALGEYLKIHRKITRKNF